MVEHQSKRGCSSRKAVSVARRPSTRQGQTGMTSMWPDLLMVCMRTCMLVA
ncbi:hypothetical protein CSA_004545 [Cucumis sativus]|uniref:Uncharacterized protein n=1 Tax=Cucumis sativus TaxID=3659 RepID=A0ACB6HC99_CUCSA|nr:hypothetical protein CSA_004545 [Cucumis sativus]